MNMNMLFCCAAEIAIRKTAKAPQAKCRFNSMITITPENLAQKSSELERRIHQCPEYKDRLTTFQVKVQLWDWDTGSFRGVVDNSIATMSILGLP